MQLAELWPDGWMDNNGIKHAVQRAKDRKKKQIKATIVREIHLRFPCKPHVPSFIRPLSGNVICAGKRRDEEEAEAEW